MTAYRYTNLSAALRDKASPLRQLFDSMLPNTRSIQDDYRAGSDRILVEGGVANAGTLGAAFDYSMRFRIQPLYGAELAKAAFLADPAAIAEIDAVIVSAQVAAALGDLEGVNRAAWALALLTEVYRVGLMPGSPLLDLRAAGCFTAAELLQLASSDALGQLDRLGSIAYGEVMSRIKEPIVLGATFDGSSLCAADADVIAAGLLLDFKTALGPKNARTGERSDRLDLMDLYQLVAYALFDRSDAYKLNELGIYSARYGHLVIWDLQSLLDNLSGESLPVSVARQRVWTALGGQ